MTGLTTDVYYDDDADVAQITQSSVAVLGYGSQGHAHAQNLSDSGVEVIVGLPEDSSSRQQAQADGLTVKTPVAAAEQADVVSILVPDTVQPALFEEIEHTLEPGNTLQFAHGFNIHYDQITPPEDVDVTLVAPKSPGHLVRRNFEEGTGTPGLMAVQQDYTGGAFDRTIAYAKAIGCTRAGVIETTFGEETETDIFGEQAVLCGGVTALVKAGFETLVDAGYSPEMAYFECLNEMKLIVDMIFEGGMGAMWDSVSHTAEYGGLSRGDRVIGPEAREAMQSILQEVQDGTFAAEWIAENQVGRPHYNKLKAAEEAHQIEAVGAPLRELFSWAEDN